MMKRCISLSVIVSFMLSFFYAQAQTENNKAYLKVITGRADKIVSTLGLTDSVKYDKVRSVIVEQYSFINTHHEQKEASIKAIKEQSKGDKSKMQAKVEKLNKRAEIRLHKQQKLYLSKLSKELSAEQVEKVKDGMTYGVLPNTYRAYQEMLPKLTNEQKKQILAYLTEAREHAISAPTSKQKHAWFGKYKGRINNYLSAQGIDMKKASLEWEERVRAAKN